MGIHLFIDMYLQFQRLRDKVFRQGWVFKSYLCLFNISQRCILINLNCGYLSSVYIGMYPHFRFSYKIKLHSYIKQKSTFFRFPLSAVFFFQN